MKEIIEIFKNTLFRVYKIFKENYKLVVLTNLVVWRHISFWNV